MSQGKVEGTCGFETLGRGYPMREVSFPSSDIHRTLEGKGCGRGGIGFRVFARPSSVQPYPFGIKVSVYRSTVSR